MRHAGWPLIALVIAVPPAVSPAAVGDYVAGIEARRAEREQRTREGEVTAFTPVAVRMPRSGETIAVGLCDGEARFDPGSACEPTVTLRYDGEGFVRRTARGEAGVSGVLDLGRFRLSLSVQGDRGRVQIHDPEAPSQKSFRGYEWYPPDPACRFLVTIEPFEDRRPVRVGTTAGLVKTFVRHGRVRFDVEGRPQSLTVYLPEGADPEDVAAYFIPFRDATTGRETYGVGRYASLERDAKGRVVLDLNLATNPSCAYNDHWNCPIPPAENRLDVPIRAGELPYPREAPGH